MCEVSVGVVVEMVFDGVVLWGLYIQMLLQMEATAQNYSTRSAISTVYRSIFEK